MCGSVPTKLISQVRDPTACVDDNVVKLRQNKICSHFGDNLEYHQINLTKHSRLLIIFLTPFGRYAFNRLPFGISVGSEVFQQYMNELLSGIEGVIIHTDDILIYAPTGEIYDNQLKRALDHIAHSGMTLNKKMCLFRQTSVKFLRHNIDGDGIQSDTEKTTTILKFLEPHNQSDIRHLNNMLNQLMKFISYLAELMAPIRQLL